MPAGRYSLNDTFEDILKTFRGKMWAIGLGLSIKKKMKANKKGNSNAPSVSDAMDMKGVMKMLGGFTVLRMTSMISMVNITITKEELLKMNKKLNKIRKPKGMK
jgi:beta-galactosidase